jgi:hypothetical protein
MQLGSITFMLAERILWKLRAKVTHHPVPHDLGDHAGGSDAQTNAITVDDGRLRKWKRDHRQPVDQDVVGRFDERFDGQAHGAMARAQNVDPIDLDRINNTDSPSDFGIGDQIRIDFLAQFWRQLFGIIQATMTKFFRKNYCGGNNRTRQRPATSFINSCNSRYAGGAQFFLVTKSASPVHFVNLAIQ